MVDYKKRAERRREYYEKIKKDPAQFLQVHGRACKVHLDSAVALAAESPVNMMPWQGDTNNMIDRFDVRAHLDHIPDYTPPLLTTISPEQESDERKCNYERYRGLVQNDFAGISEEQCLYQIYIDELYGGLQRPSEDEKKKLAEKKASIGYTYEDSTVAEVEKVTEKPEEEESPAEEESNSDEDEVIPDIGGVPSLPSPSTVPGQRFRVSPLPLCGASRAYEPASPDPHLPLSFRLTCVLLLQPPSLFLSPSYFLGLCSSDTVPTWVLALFSSSDFSLLVSPRPSLSLSS